MSDVLGRALGEKLAPVFGRNFIVENRAGAGGTLGATSVARAAPDGHTLLVGHIEWVDTEIGRVPYLKIRHSKWF